MGGDRGATFERRLARLAVRGVLGEPGGGRGEIAARERREHRREAFAGGGHGTGGFPARTASIIVLTPSAADVLPSLR